MGILKNALKHVYPTPNYKNIVIADNPIIYYSFDNTSGTPVDETGFSAIAATKGSGSPDLTVAGPTNALNTAVDFNNQSYYELNKSPAQLGVDGDKSRTIEAWIYPETFQERQTFWDFGGEGGTNNQDFNLSQMTITDTFRIGVWGVGNDFDFTITNALRTWWFVVVTYDNANGTLEVWVNASLIASVSRSPNTADGTSRFGFVSNPASPQNPQSGRLDEVAVYDKVLAGTDIQKHYDTALGNL